MAEKRKDKKGRVLKEGESQRIDGTYDYRWRTSDGKGILFMQKRLKNCGRKNRLYRKIKVTVLELTLKM